jgi:hypothetical protein
MSTHLLSRLQRRTWKIVYEKTSCSTSYHGDVERCSYICVSRRQCFPSNIRPVPRPGVCGDVQSTVIRRVMFQLRVATLHKISKLKTVTTMDCSGGRTIINGPEAELYHHHRTVPA